jgi:hypothetical protein
MLYLRKFHLILLLISCSGLVQWSYSTELYIHNNNSTPKLVTTFEFVHEDYVEYRKHVHNYWHLMFGVLIPMTVELLDQFSCMVQQYQHSTKASSFLLQGLMQQQGKPVITVQIGNIGNLTSRSQLEQYFDEFLNVNFEVKFLSKSLEHSHSPWYAPTVYLKRCDIPHRKLPFPRLPSQVTCSINSSGNISITHGVKYKPYFDTCFEENVYLKFRHYLGLLTPSDWGKQVSIPHDLDETKRVLIILRRCIPQDLVEGPHLHHAICFEHNSSKYQRIVDGLHQLGFTTHSTYLDNTTIKTQANMFANASIIIIPHGAAIANCIFARSGTLIVEITPYIIMRETNPKEILHRAVLHVQRLVSGREMLQKLCRRFWSRGILLRHIVIPSTTESYAAKNEFLKGCDDWTCYEVDEVLEVISNEYRELQGVLKKVYM